jgi:hypothetical protein
VLRRSLSIVAVAAAALGVMTVAQASGTVDIGNGGDDHESVGQEDSKTMMRPGVTYTATTFPLAFTVRAPDALWGGVQLQSRGFRFVQFHHLRAGNTPLHGWGFVTLEASTGRTGSVSATVKKLSSTPNLEPGPIRTTRVAGFTGKTFDATITGIDKPDGGQGIALAPFTTRHACGFCEVTMHHETLDHKFAGKGQLFRISVLSARGKTVVIYLESSRSDSTTRKNPPTKTFPTFLPYAKKLLSTLRFAS